MLYLVRWLWEKLFHPDVARIFGLELNRIDNHEWHENRPAPIGDFTEVKRKPPWQMHDFHRHDRHGAPRHGTKKRQQCPGKYIAAGRATMIQNGRPRPLHVRGIGRITNGLKREIGFDA